MAHIKEYSGGVLRWILLLAGLRGPARLQKGRIDESNCSVGTFECNKRRYKGANVPSLRHA